MSDNARNIRKAEREKREARKRAERTADVRHLKEELMAGENQMLDSYKKVDIDPHMLGFIDKSVANKLAELEKRYKIRPDQSDMLTQLALLYRFYPDFFLEKCGYMEQCFNAGIDPFELIGMGQDHMEFSMNFLYEIQAMRKGVRLAKKRKAESLKSKDDRRFAKVYYQHLNRKDTLENLLKNEFPKRIDKSKEFETYNRLKSAYYRAVNRIFRKEELTFDDLWHFCWDKTAFLFGCDSELNLLSMTWRAVFKSSKTRSKIGVVRDYIFGVNTKKIIMGNTFNRRSPYDEMWYRLAPKQPNKE